MSEITITKWQCDECLRVYDLKAEADTCAAGHLQEDMATRPAMSVLTFHPELSTHYLPGVVVQRAELGKGRYRALVEDESGERRWYDGAQLLAWKQSQEPVSKET